MHSFWIINHAAVDCSQFMTLHEFGMYESLTDCDKLDVQKMAVQTAQLGGARRLRRDEDRAPAPVAAPAYGGEAEGYGNFSRGRDRDSSRGSSYGDAWGAARGKSGAEACYNCGQVCACCHIESFCAKIP
jgi:hypothetical protein